MTWENRDFPVLKAIVALSDEGDGRVEWRSIVERTGIGEEEVQRAIRALSQEEPAFFDFTDTSSQARREIGLVYDVTGHARRTVGTWPTPETLAKKIIAELHAAAEAEPDEEKRSRLKKTADWFGTTGWSVILGVAGNAVSKSIGI
ncbi:hypothetical protein [Streptosporangium sp. V21-05]|uniref:hypothetical protein n=1 Tax=Streptosporangium sp. V21-05 TaxID=3446115 RepID=UPI003F53BBA3